MKKLTLTILSAALLVGAGYGCAHKAETKSTSEAVTTVDAGPAPAAEPAPAPVNAPPN